MTEDKAKRPGYLKPFKYLTIGVMLFTAAIWIEWLRFPGVSAAAMASFKIPALVLALIFMFAANIRPRPGEYWRSFWRKTATCLFVWGVLFNDVVWGYLIYRDKCATEAGLRVFKTGYAPRALVLLEGEPEGCFFCAAYLSIPELGLEYFETSSLEEGWKFPDRYKHRYDMAPTEAQWRREVEAMGQESYRQEKVSADNPFCQGRYIYVPEELTGHDDPEFCLRAERITTGKFTAPLLLTYLSRKDNRTYRGLYSHTAFEIIDNQGLIDMTSGQLVAQYSAFQYEQGFFVRLMSDLILLIPMDAPWPIVFPVRSSWTNQGSCIR